MSRAYGQNKLNREKTNTVVPIIIEKERWLKKDAGKWWLDIKYDIQRGLHNIIKEEKRISGWPIYVHTSDKLRTTRESEFTKNLKKRREIN